MSCVYRRLAYRASEDKRAGIRHGIVPRYERRHWIEWQTRGDNRATAKPDV